MICVIRDDLYFGSACFESGDFFRGCGVSAEEEKVICCGAYELRGEWGAELGVEEDAEERAASGQAAAIRELGVVGEDGADAGEDGVAGVAEALHFVASGGAREPVRLIGVAAFRVTKGVRVWMK